MPNTTAVRTAQVGAAPLFAGKNAVINGGMDIWQRGTSAASVAPNTYSPADRWYLGMGTTGRTISRQTSSLTGIQYSLRIQRDSGNSSTLASYLSYTLESADSYRFAGKTITLSFYARAGANYSPTSSLLSTTLLSGTGTDQNVQNTWTGSATVASGNATLTTSWQRFSFTGTVASSATELGFYWIASWIGTAGANDWFEVTGVQLEAGSTATSFQTATGTIQGELAACERYFQREADSQKSIGAGSYYTTTEAWIPYFLKTTMRVAPTVTFDGTGTVTVYDAGSARTSTAVTTDAISPRVVEIKATTSSTTAGRAAFARIAGSGNFINFSAEL